MTYNVFGGTLNLAQSLLNQSVNDVKETRRKFAANCRLVSSTVSDHIFSDHIF